MLKFKGMLIVGLVACFVAAPALAIDSTLYFTTREYQTGAPGFKAQVDPPSFPDLATVSATPVMYLQPTMGGNEIRGSDDTSAKSFNVWWNVNEKYPGFAEVQSSMGLGLTRTKVLGSGNPLTENVPAYTVTIYQAPADTRNAVDAWSGQNIISLDDIRAVTVPSSLAAFSTLGYPPNAAGESYRVMSIAVQSSAGCKGMTPTAYELRLNVGPLLTTRVVDPAQGAPTAEDLAGGFSGGSPEAMSGGPNGCAAAGSGSCAGATTVVADAIVDIRFKGDAAGGLGGVPDGNVDAADNLNFNLTKTAGAGATAERKFTYDFSGGVGGVPDGVVDAADNLGFNNTKTFFPTFASCDGGAAPADGGARPRPQQKIRR